MQPIVIKVCKEYKIRIPDKSYGAYNNTQSYLALCLENAVFLPCSGEFIDTLILAPQEKTKGHFDGAITEDGTVLKVSARAPLYVNFEVFEDTEGNFQLKIADTLSIIVNKVSDAYKVIYNIVQKKNKLFSGVYREQNKPGAKLYTWWKTATNDKEAGEPEKWAENYKSSRQCELRQLLNGN